MKNKIAIVTDSAANLDATVVAGLNITVIHAPIVLGGKTYYEDIDLDASQLQELCTTTKEVPIPGQVSLATFEQIFANLQTSGYTQVLCILTAGGISSLVSTVNGYMNSVAGLEVHVFDAHTSGLGLAQMVQFAGLAAQRAVSLPTILAGLDELRASFHDVWVIDDLRSLMRTGYISNGATSFSNRMMRLKTLLTFNDSGQLEAVDTQFRLKKALQYVDHHLVPDYQNNHDQLRINVADNDNQELRDKWLTNLQTNFPAAHFATAPIKPSLAQHTGDNGLIISWGLDYLALVKKYSN